MTFEFAMEEELAAKLKVVGVGGAGGNAVNRMIEDGKSRAKKTADEVVEKARLESQDMSEKAKAEIIRERENAISEIRDHMVRISLKAAEQLIKKTLVEADHRAFIEKAIAQIDEEVK